MTRNDWSRWSPIYQQCKQKVERLNTVPSCKQLQAPPVRIPKKSKYKSIREHPSELQLNTSGDQLRMTMSLSNSAILITGASGFLGSSIVKHLLANAVAPVRLLLRPNSNLGKVGLDPNDPRLQIYRLSNDNSEMAEAVKDVDYVFNCAGFVVDYGSMDEFVGANVEFPVRLLQAISNSNITRFIHISTADVYGYPKVPFQDEQNQPLFDTGLPYNSTKILGEKKVIEICDKNGVEWTVIRPTNIYGPGSKDFIVEMAQVLWEGSMPIIDGGRADAGLLYIDDVVNAILTCATNSNAKNQIYNVWGGERITWKVYFDMLADSLKLKRAWISLPFAVCYFLGWLLETLWGILKLQKRPLLTRHVVYLLTRSMDCPIDKATKDFGFQPKVLLADGMERCVNWLRNQEEYAHITANIRKKKPEIEIMS